MSSSEDPMGTGVDGGGSGEAEVDECSMSNDDSQRGLRIAAIFIILVTSLIGTFVPIFFRQSTVIPRPVFEFAKFFGSGVIIATAFIHLLAPAWDELTSPCLTGAWTEYDWAPAIAMISVYGIFFAEVAAYRIGTSKLARMGVNYNPHHGDHSDAHAHDHAEGEAIIPGNGTTSGPEHTLTADDETRVGGTRGYSTNEKKDLESEEYYETHQHMGADAEASGQLIAVGVLEFGVILHSIIIGLTLGVTDEFTTLFVVIIFHQMFEGLGLGSRLSGLILPKHLGWTRYAGGALYAICTPIGVASGIGARNSYNGNGATANIVSGLLDAISAGILLYTGLVELMAHEILLNPRMMTSSSGKLAYIFCCMLLGSGLMALLGRWA